MRILITRPLNRALVLADRLRESGHQPLIDPLLKMIPLPVTLPPLASFQAILTTSPYAIGCLSRLTAERHFPLWCAGRASAEAAMGSGFSNVHAGEGSAYGLVTGLLKSMPALPLPFLHLRGDIIRLDITEVLGKYGVTAHSLIVYETQEAQAFLPPTLYALDARQLDAILFYSPRTASLFTKLCRAANIGQQCKSLIAACLSREIAQEISGISWRDIRIAKKNTTDDLLMALMMAN